MSGPVGRGSLERYAFLWRPGVVQALDEGAIFPLSDALPWLPVATHTLGYSFPRQRRICGRIGDSTANLYDLTNTSNPRKATGRVS